MNKLKAARVPIFLLVLVLLYLLLSTYGFLPSTDNLIGYIEQFVKVKGGIAVFIIALIENTAVVNVYFPGSVAILTAMAVTNGDPSAALVIFNFIVWPSFAAQIFNYHIGKRFRNFSLNTTDQISNERAPKWIWLWYFSTYWHPQLGSATSVASGSECFSFVTFMKYMIPVFIFWNVFWGVSMYNLGNFIKAGDTLLYIYSFYLLGWIAYDLRKAVQKGNDATVSLR